MRMSRGMVGVLACVLLSGVVGQLWAAEFQPIGSRAISMGGAGVASSRGAFAPYFNPALLARSDHRAHFAFEAGVGYREVNLIQAASDLDDADMDDTFDAFSDSALSGRPLSDELRQNLRTIDRSIRSMAEENGLQLMPSASLGMQIGRLGLGCFFLADATAYAVIDSTRLDMIVEDRGRYFEYDLETGNYSEVSRTDYDTRALEYAIDNGHTYVQMTGVSYAEIPLAYAHQFETGVGKVALGASVKFMPGTAFDLRVDVDTDEFSDEWSDAQNNDNAFGVDAGLLVMPGHEDRLVLGLVVKNMNTPEFALEDNRKLEVKPQARAGVAYAFTDAWELAMDVDLTRNETFLPGLESQMIGGGISFHPRSWFSLRGGLMANLAEPDDGVMVTGGLGLGLKWFQLDLSAQMSTNSTEYEGDDIPRTARAQLALVSKWN